LDPLHQGDYPWPAKQLGVESLGIYRRSVVSGCGPEKMEIRHPFGMTGSRMTGQLLRELERQGERFGIVTMCVGGGQGFATLFETG
jgi:hypothetical protein